VHLAQQPHLSCGWAVSALYFPYTLWSPAYLTRPQVMQGELSLSLSYRGWAPSTCGPPSEMIMDSTDLAPPSAGGRLVHSSLDCAW
jgi:hypothetical protein